MSYIKLCSVKIKFVNYFQKLNQKLLFQYITNKMKHKVKSIKNKVEDFLKDHPKCRNILTNIVETWEEKINEEEYVYKKEKVFEKAKEFCEYDAANFKKSAFPGFKYKLELLKTNDEDYEFFENSIKSNDNFSTKILKYMLDIKNNTEV